MASLSIHLSVFLYHSVSLDIYLSTYLPYYVFFIYNWVTLYISPTTMPNFCHFSLFFPNDSLLPPILLTLPSWHSLTGICGGGGGGGGQGLGRALVGSGRVGQYLVPVIKSKEAAEVPKRCEAVGRLSSPFYLPGDMCVSRTITYLTRRPANFKRCHFAL